VQKKCSLIAAARPASANCVGSFSGHLTMAKSLLCSVTPVFNRLFSGSMCSMMPPALRMSSASSLVLMLLIIMPLNMLFIFVSLPQSNKSVRKSNGV